MEFLQNILHGVFELPLPSNAQTRRGALKQKPNFKSTHPPRPFVFKKKMNCLCVCAFPGVSQQVEFKNSIKTFL
jgi:hypothetical protein